MAPPNAEAVRALEASHPDRKARLTELRKIVNETQSLPKLSLDRKAVFRETHTMLLEMRSKISKERGNANADVSALDEEERAVEQLQQKVLGVLREDHTGSLDHVGAEVRNAAGVLGEMGKQESVGKALDTLGKQDFATQAVVVGGVAVVGSTLYGMVRNWFRKADEKTGVWSWAKRTALSIAGALGLLGLWNLLNRKFGLGGGYGERGEKSGNTEKPKNDKTGPPPPPAPPPDAKGKPVERKEKEADPGDVYSERELRGSERKEVMNWRFSVECLSWYSAKPDAAAMAQPHYRNLRTGQKYTEAEMVARLKVLKEEHRKVYGTNPDGGHLMLEVQTHPSTPFPFWQREYRHSLAQQAGVGYISSANSGRESYPANEPYNDQRWNEKFASTTYKVEFRNGKPEQMGNIRYLAADEYSRRLAQEAKFGNSAVKRFQETYKKIEEFGTPEGAARVILYLSQDTNKIPDIPAIVASFKEPEKCHFDIYSRIVIAGPASIPPAEGDKAFHFEGSKELMTVETLRQKLNVIVGQCAPAKAHLSLTFIRDPNSQAASKLLQPLIDQLDKEGHRMMMSDDHGESAKTNTRTTDRPK